ncbi:MAG: glycosyltransferase family 4 protein [Chitinispirillaceae bacterium]|nr:glycosyltransferase family 4 protein [Chitinispirillaceae bacterium]
MNIGYIFNHNAIIGGGEFSFIDLIAAVGGTGVTPVAIVPGNGEIEQRITALGIPVELTEFRRLSPLSLPEWPGQVKRLAGTFSRLKLDLIHVNGARSMLYAGPAAKRAGIPCVWHNRVLHREGLLDRIRGRYADAVIANSSAVAATLEQSGIRNVSVVYNGFHLDAIMKQEALDIRREFQVAPGVPVVLAVGRLSPWKGFLDLLKACALLNNRNVPFFCMIVGKSVPEERGHVALLLDMKDRLRLSNVHFTGWRGDVAAIMKAATLLAVPSHGEPFGRIIVEAWACGLPVVATDAGGPAELIRDNENGFLVPVQNPPALAEAIGTLLARPERRAALCAAGKKRANDFSIERHRDTVMAIYKRLLQRNGTDRGRRPVP